MKEKYILFLSLIMIIFVSGCFALQLGGSGPPEFIETVTVIEEIDNSSQILEVRKVVAGSEYIIQHINYTKDDRVYENYWDNRLRNSLDFIKEHNGETKYLCWWDYGHMIRGYAKTDVIIYSPSEDILYTLASGQWDTEKSGEFSDPQVVKDVALALTTNDKQELTDTMNKYGADHVFVASSDIAKSISILQTAGRDTSEYFYGEERTDNFKEMMLYKMVNKEDIQGFNLVYSDDYAVIYSKE